jgi:hypothetical protein
MKIPNRAKCIVYSLIEADDFTIGDAEAFLKRVPPYPPSALLQDVIEKREEQLHKLHQGTSVHTNRQGETFCFGKFGTGKRGVVVTMLWFDPRKVKWVEYGHGRVGEALDPDDPAWRTLPEHPLKRLRRRRKMGESLSDKEIQRYLSGVKARPGLKRYSTTQLVRFLRRRQPAQPEPPGEPHRVVPQQEGQSIEQRLVKASKKITHCGDYGTLFYHPGKRAVHWNMADSDGSPDYTSSDEIRELLSLPGITYVELGDEWSPKEADGWKRLA